jgi:glucokinase
VLIGDIGGTNCRIGLAAWREGVPAVLERRTYSTDDFTSPAEAIARFLEEVPDARPVKSACVAVAGPVTGDEIDLTNCAWTFSRTRVQARLNLDHLLIINDLHALARAVLDLQPTEFVAIGEIVGPAVDGPIAVVAPGTGLGAAMAFDAPIRFVCPTEAGHVGFAPGDDVELELLRLWRPHLGRVRNEHLLSGPGLVRLYRALGALEDTHVEPLGGPEILEKAVAGSDTLCLRAAERFAKILGAVCGDITLTQGARQVVLSGSIVTSLQPILRQGGFRARFEQRGPTGEYMRQRGTLVAARADLGLVGAFLCLDDHLLSAGS